MPENDTCAGGIRRYSGPWPSGDVAVYCRPNHAIVAPLHLREFDGDVFMSAVGFQTPGKPGDNTDILGWLTSEYWDAYEVPADWAPDTIPWPTDEEEQELITATDSGNRRDVGTGMERFGPATVTCPYCLDDVEIEAGPTRRVEIQHDDCDWFMADLADETAGKGTWTDSGGEQDV